MIPSQMLKGMLDGCILKVISLHKTYGYEISEQLKAFGFSEISEGTIYPLLLRLERNGMVAASFEESPVGPKRKYFSITEKGEEEIRSFYDSFCELQQAVNAIFQQGEQEHA